MKKLNNLYDGKYISKIFHYINYTLIADISKCPISRLELN